MWHTPHDDDVHRDDDDDDDDNDDSEDRVLPMWHEMVVL